MKGECPVFPFSHEDSRKGAIIVTSPCGCLGFVGTDAHENETCCLSKEIDGEKEVSNQDIEGPYDEETIWIQQEYRPRWEHYCLNY